MKSVYNSIKTFFSRLLDYIPTTVPQGRTDLENLVSRLMTNYTPPMSQRDVTWVVCTILQRFDPLQGRYPVYKYSLALKRAAAGQVGVMIMQELKEAQAAEALAAQQAAATQATPAPVAAPTTPVANEPIQNTPVSST